MKKILKFLDDNLEATLLVILLGAISVIMMLQIIMRSIGSALTWPEEFCRICFVYSGFICMSYCQKKRSAIKIDVLVNQLPASIKKVIDILGEILMFAFYLFLFVESIALLKTTTAGGSRTSALGIPLTFVYFALTLGVGLAAFRSIEQFVKFLFSKIKK